MIKFLVLQGMVAWCKLKDLTLRVHVVLHDHVQIVHPDLAMSLTKYQFASVEKVAERKRTWDFDSVKMHECF